MPNIAEMSSILKYTPESQAIMLSGIHGVGKSEFIKKIYEDLGYRVITIFLGQMNDSGDLIGLPNRTEVEFVYNGQVVKQTITEFCPPKWFPRNENEKIVIFLDEFNRGKADVYQCIFDMVLNRKLNGFPLPVHTRIIAAINPTEDEYDYDVVQLDPALVDRFNVYTFSPTVDEWLNWAVSQKLSTHVMGFINKNNQQLDPPNAKSNTKIDNVTPSRRSWKRVSDILNNHPELLINDDLITLKNILIGIIGEGATAKFAQYIKETVTSISGAKIVTGWNKEVAEQLKTYSNQNLVYLNKEIAMYLETQEVILFDGDAKAAQQYATNIENYLKSIPHEIVADFVNLAQSAEIRKIHWGEKLLNCNNHGITEFFLDVYNGKTKHDKNVENIIKESDDDSDWKSGDPDIDDIINGR